MVKEADKPVDAVAVWQAAMAYLHAAERLQKAMMDDQRDGVLNPDLCVPHTMLTAFSCELCLKAAYAAENNGKQVYGHNLLKLFGNLSPQLQALIRREWPRCLAQNVTVTEMLKHMPDLNVEFDHNLDISKDAFVDYRYIYENKGATFLLGTLPILLRTVLGTIIPAFGAAGPRFRQLGYLDDPETQAKVKDQTHVMIQWTKQGQPDDSPPAG